MTSSLALLTTQAQALDHPVPCHRENPQLWFSDLPADLQLAKAYCQPCPIRQICLAGAVERHEPHGVWGGEIFERGAAIARKRPRGRPAVRHLGPAPGSVPRQLPAKPAADYVIHGRQVGLTLRQDALSGVLMTCP